MIIQSWPGDISKHGEIHIYHSVKGSTSTTNGIRHRVSTTNGKSWEASELVLTTTLQPGTLPAESIAGKYFPSLFGGKGAMVLITDGGIGSSPLHAYVSSTPGNMSSFVAAAEPTLSPSELPPTARSQLVPPKHPPHKGEWAMNQIAFVPDKWGAITGVSYARYTGEVVYAIGHKQNSMAYTHTIYNISVV